MSFRLSLFLTLSSCRDAFSIFVSCIMEVVLNLLFFLLLQESQNVCSYGFHGSASLRGWWVVNDLIHVVSFFGVSIIPAKQNKYYHIASDIHGKTTFAYTNLFCVKIYHGGCDNHRRPRNAIIINFTADTGDARENKVWFLAATLPKMGRGGKLFFLSLQTGKAPGECCVYARCFEKPPDRYLTKKNLGNLRLLSLLMPLNILSCPPLPCDLFLVVTGFRCEWKQAKRLK